MIEVDNLTVRLGQRTIIDGYSLSVPQGAVLAILGTNGVGKTTLLSSVAGLLRPSSGWARSTGTIGYVPQLFQAAFSFSVIDMVLMGRARHIGVFGAPRVRDYEVARRYLDLLGISDLEARGFNTLSGGQRQLVIIAQALTSECNLLILDEPCSALDYGNQSLVISAMRRLNREYGHTIIFTTHAPQHALEIASDVLLMMTARDYRYGPMQQVLTEENLSDLYGARIERADFRATGGHTFAPRYAAVSP